MAYSKFSQMSKEEKLEARKAAYKKYYMTKLGKTTPVNLNVIAKEVGMSLAELEHYKFKDKWIKRVEKDIAAKAGAKEIAKQAKQLEIDDKIREEEIETVQTILDNADISERWKLFIMYYLQCYSPAQAALKAGYSKNAASSAGLSLLREKRIQEVLSKIKNVINKSLYIDAHDILAEYAKIAFADITDFVQVKNGRVIIKDSNQIDGTVVTEIKRGKDGISIKLADKMKALEKLERLLEAIPDRKLQLDIAKFEFTKQLAEKDAKGNGGKVIIVNDL